MLKVLIRGSYIPATGGGQKFLRCVTHSHVSSLKLRKTRLSTKPECLNQLAVFQDGLSIVLVLLISPCS